MAKPETPPPSWDLIFNATLSHGFPDVASAAVAARGCGYPFLCWRDRIYAVSINDDGHAAWPTWDDTGYHAADVPAPPARVKEADCAALAAELVVDAADDVDVTSTLDGLVHDRKGDEAAAINNEGIEAQVRYLLESDVSERTIRDACCRAASEETRSA